MPTDLAAYRIIQESLTNAIRHAEPAQATVSLTYSDAELLIEVADNGAGAPQNMSKDGHGLIGMRERAAAAGGTMRAGSAPVKVIILTTFESDEYVYRQSGSARAAFW